MTEIGIRKKLLMRNNYTVNQLITNHYLYLHNLIKTMLFSRVTGQKPESWVLQNLMNSLCTNVTSTESHPLAVFGSESESDLRVLQPSVAVTVLSDALHC